MLLPAIIGVLLIGAFVFWSFKPKHPLLDLRLFKDRNLTVSIITMFLFAGAFFGALLLVPTYFQQVDGYSVKKAGLLVAAQGIGAMITMPIAGALTDKMPVGRIVPFGFLGILIGMFGLDPEHRRGHLRLDHHGLAVRDRSRHGRDDDAAVHLGAQDPQGRRRGPRVDAAQRDAAGRERDRHRDDLGRPDQRHEERRRPRRAPRSSPASTAD